MIDIGAGNGPCMMLCPAHIVTQEKVEHFKEHGNFILFDMDFDDYVKKYGLEYVNTHFIRTSQCMALDCDENGAYIFPTANTITKSWYCWA